MAILFLGGNVGYVFTVRKNCQGLSHVLLAEGKLILTAKNLTYYRSERLVLGNLNFAVAAGELLQIIGANGVGKTTLLRILAGILQPQQGEIYWKGQAISQDKFTYYQHLCYLGHDLGIKSQLTVAENLRLYWHWHVPTTQQINNTLEALGLSDYSNTLCEKLSRGQQQRVALARLILSQATLWILDEPFSALDVSAKMHIAQVLENKVQQGGSVIFTAHQPMNMLDLQIKTLHLLSATANDIGEIVVAQA